MTDTSDSINLLIYLLGAVGMDLLFRWVAFERIESLAIDISIFSAVYSFFEMLKAADGHSPWRMPTLFGFICIFGLSALHRFLTSQLKETIEDTYKTLQQKMTDPNKKDVINLNIPVAKYSIMVELWPEVSSFTLLSWVRMGKAKRRMNIIEALRQAELDPTGYLREESFLLPLGLRKLMLPIFFLGGAISVAIPLFYSLFYASKLNGH